MDSVVSSAPGQRGWIELKGVGDGAIADKPDDEWLMIEASHLKVQPPAAVEKGSQQISRTKRGSTPN